MADIVERLRLYAQQFEDQHAPDEITLAMRAGADEIERKDAEIASLLNTLADARTESMRLRAALVEMVQEDATNARRMRAAIVAAREKMAKTRFTWNGMIIQADGILEKALTVNNARAALEGK